MTVSLAKPLLVESVRLTHGDFANEGDARSIRALLFGELVKRATPIESYHSDLFHDALWIDKYVTGEFTWYWMVHDSGTHIGTDLAAAVHVYGSHSTSVYYRISLTQGRLDFWIVTFETFATH